MFSILGLFFLTLFISILLIPVAIKLAFKINFLDIPQKHKTHKIPVPYMGGLVIYIAFICGIMVAHFSLHWFDTKTFSLFFIASSAICLLGLYDDYKGMPARVKLLGQIIISLYLIQNGICIERVSHPFLTGVSIELGWWGYLITLMWLVGITNSINLLDGLDGLAGGVSTILLVFMLSFAIF